MLERIFGDQQCPVQSRMKFKEHCLVPWPIWFWISPRMKIPQPLWEPVPEFEHLHEKCGGLCCLDTQDKLLIIRKIKRNLDIVIEEQLAYENRLLEQGGQLLSRWQGKSLLQQKSLQLHHHLYQMRLPESLLCSILIIQLFHSPADHSSLISRVYLCQWNT